MTVVSLDAYRAPSPVAATEYETRGAVSLDTLKSMYREAETMCQAGQAERERDEDYYDGHHWTDEERRELRRRSQPDIVINRVRRKINWLIGYEQQSRSDPRAWPRTPSSEPQADVVTKTLRFIGDDAGLDQVYSEAFADLLKAGYCVLEPTVEPRPRGNPKIVVYSHPWREFFYDPRSRKADFSDARYLGVAKWLDREQLADRHPQFADRIGEMLEGMPVDASRDDKPTGFWGDRHRQRLLVVQMRHIVNGIWHICEFTGSTVLMSTASPYLDDEGRPWSGLIAQSLYVTRELDRHGVIRDMRGPQDEINHRRSKLLHQLSHRQTYGRKGAVNDAEAMRRALTRADGHVEINPGTQWGADVGIIENRDQIAGQAQLLAEAKAEIDVQGPNAGLQGRGVEDQSGRAIMAQQQAGLAEENLAFDRLRDLKRRTWRAVWALARQFWRHEQWVRVTASGQQAGFVGLNVPQGVDPYGRSIVANAIADLDADIELEETPRTPNLQYEQFQTLGQLLPAIVNAPPIWAELLIEASALHNKQELLERLRASQGADPMAQMQARMAAERAAAEIDKTRAGAEKDRAQAAKAMREATPPPAVYTAAGYPIG